MSKNSLITLIRQKLYPIKVIRGKKTKKLTNIKVIKSIVINGFRLFFC
jgi:hypothetical protein